MEGPGFSTSKGDPVYRLLISVYGTEPRAYVHALFEQETEGKTQVLAKQGIYQPSNEVFEKGTHAEILYEIGGFVPYMVNLLAARLDDDPLFDR